MELKQQINECMEELLDKIAVLVQYDSQMADPLPGMPYGEQPAAALAEMLKICEDMGFKTKNVDNYFGYAEMGEGEELIGIAGHLDIVPAGEGWTHDPFRMSREGDLIYGRGVTDDKGPLIQALYAMKLLRDNGVKLNKRVRLIFGCNEENGSGCMQHYTKVEEPLTMGFTPDAEYPCIYGEKGMLDLLASSKNTRIISMNGGFVSNAVCNQCTTVIPAEVSVEALKEALGRTALTSYTVTEADGQLTIQAQGVAAHASTPLLGINAAGCTMEALMAAGFDDDFVKYYNAHVGVKCDGEGYGLKLQDDYGDLTLNNGIVYTDDQGIHCTLDLRTPVTYTGEQLLAACAPYLEDENGVTEVVEVRKSLFFPRESALVNALYNAYVDVTGDTVNQPMVIGGGTYAKELAGIIAFGPEKPDKDYRIHNADEFASVSEMVENIEIYYRAILNMLAIE